MLRATVKVVVPPSRTIETTDDAVADMVEAYVRGLDTAGTQIALAYRNADVRRLNMNIRALLRDTDRLGPDVLFRARDGELGFAPRDRVLFLETAKVGAVQVDKIDNESAVVLRDIEGKLSLEVIALP